MYKISVWMVTLKTLKLVWNSVENLSIFFITLNMANKKVRNKEFTYLTNFTSIAFTPVYWCCLLVYWC